jgi:hypothetical protein
VDSPQRAPAGVSQSGAWRLIESEGQFLMVVATVGVASGEDGRSRIIRLRHRVRARTSLRCWMYGHALWRARRGAAKCVMLGMITPA